jgi:hypothetical protein
MYVGKPGPIHAATACQNPVAAATAATAKP